MSTDTADTRLTGTLWRETEFVGGLTGACGPNALSMAASWARQRHISTLDTFHVMRAAKPTPLCDPNGVSNIGDLRAAVPFLGLTAPAYRAYAEPWDYAAFRAWMLAQLAAGRAVVIEVANGQALVDALTGKGENARNLRYHFFTIVGYVSGRWVCLDGDNFAVGNVAQHYTDAVMSAARPCAALAIAPVKGVKIMPTTTGAGAGFDTYAAANAITARLDAYIPLDAEHATAVYDDGTVLWWQSGQDISASRAGTALLAVNAHRVTAEAEATALRQQLATAEAEVASLKQQLADAKAATPAPTPVPATDPEAVKALALVSAIRAALLPA